MQLTNFPMRAKASQEALITASKVFVKDILFRNECQKAFDLIKARK